MAYIEIAVANETIQMFTLFDRRPAAGSSQPTKWIYQMDLEIILYNNNGDDDTSRSTGAAYRLLQRTPGAAGQALCLRRGSIGQGLITNAEWDLLRDPLHASVRMLTLVPVETAVNAATVFGETKASAARSSRRSGTTGQPSGTKMRV